MYPSAESAQPFTPTPVPAKKPRKTWLIVLLAIFGLVIISIVLVVALVFGTYKGVTKALRSSDVYKTSLADANASPCLVQKLGSPITATGTPSGSINENNGQGNADLTTAIQGPNGSGTLHAIATRDASIWTITSLDFTQAGTTTTLLPTPSPCQ